MSNTWFRMYAEFANDPKVQMMSESFQRRLVMLFCFKCNVTVTLHDEEVTFLLRISNEEWRETKQVFIQKGFIDSDNNLLNWDKRQFVSDSSKGRVAAYRERKKAEKTSGYDASTAEQQSGNGDVTLPKRYSNAIDTEQIQNRTDTEQNKNHASSDNDLLADVVENPSVENPSLACPYAKLIEVYHAHFPVGAKVLVLNDQRKRAMKQRWLEASRLQIAPFGYASVEDGLNAWAEFFDVCMESDFLAGRAPPTDPNRKPFSADLDFFMQPKSFAKCLENKYH